MEHFPEVLRLIDAAVRHDRQQAVDYGLLLAGKLDKDGATRQASSIRAALAKSETRTMRAAGVDRLPQDETSSMDMVDVELPAGRYGELVLPARIRERIDEFLQVVEFREKLLNAGLNSPSRLLLHGPPGTGKTSIARLLANQLDLPLLTARADSIVSSLLGQTSRNLRAVFDFAARTPCVLFLDEFDSIAKARADTQEVGELQRVVIAVLQNLDSLPTDTLVVAATNHPQLLDPAVWRRFEFVVETVNPGATERALQWSTALISVPPTPKELDVLTVASSGLSNAAIAAAAREILQEAVIAERDKLDMPIAMRKLSRYCWNDGRGGVGDTESEVIALRAWQPLVFTIRALSRLFGVSTRQVQNMTGGGEDGGDSEPTDRDAFRESRVQ